MRESSEQRHEQRNPAPAAAPLGALGEAIDQIRAGNGPTDKTCLRGAVLRGQDLAGLNLAGFDLEQSDLSNANLSGANLAGARLRGCNLYAANLDDAEMLGADLSEADLTECSAHRTGFSGATLRGATFFHARAAAASFTRADLQGADLRAANAPGARFREARLQGADLSHAVLSEADLDETQVEGANFGDADLSAASFRAMHGGTEANWVGAIIRNVDFCGAYMVRRHILDENYLHEFRSSSRTHRWIYWVWWATSDCGRSFGRWGFLTMVIGMAYALLFLAIDLKMPDGGEHGLIDTTYFSFVTLTTLGYGDIVATTGLGRMVALSEVLIGYMMIGGLLSIFANKMARRAE